MKNPILVVSLVFLLCFAFGCQNKAEKATSKQETGERSAVGAEEREKIVSEVTTAMNSYMAAIKALNVDKAISHYAQEAEFRVFSDGKILDYEGWLSQAKADFSQFSGVEGEWQGITVVILGPGVAAAAAPFRETLIDKAGQRTAIKGTVTWIWVRRESGWKILYGHGTHELDTGS